MFSKTIKIDSSKICRLLNISSSAWYKNELRNLLIVKDIPHKSRTLDLQKTGFSEDRSNLFQFNIFFPILKSHKLNFAIKFELQETGQRSEDLWNPKTTTIKKKEIMGNGNLEMRINGCLHLKSKLQMWISRKPAMLPHPWVGTTK